MRKFFALCLALSMMFAAEAQAAGGTKVIKLTTTMGVIVLELNEEKAPITTANFVQYVKDGHFDGTIFHRVIPNFMIQGGGFNVDMKQLPVRDAIKNEADNGLSNEKYTVAMARTPNPDSATAQFFINVRDNSNLDFVSPSPSGWGYAVFGKVTEGFDVVDQIALVKTGTRPPHGDVPVEPIIITKAEVIE